MRLNDKLQSSKKNEFYYSRFFLIIPLRRWSGLDYIRSGTLMPSSDMAEAMTRAV